MVVSVQKPNEASIRRFLEGQRPLKLTYPEVGATCGELPSNYVIDRTRVKLGVGSEVFARAADAIRNLEHLRLGWVEPFPLERTIAVGNVVGVLVRVATLWWLNACQIVRVVDEVENTARFGFVYGTLPGHAECGEEKFIVEWNCVENSVWYEILAFSRPRAFLARLGYPVARRVQGRFASESAAAMLRAVTNLN